MDPVDLNDPDDMPKVRETLRLAGIDPDVLSDDQAREALAKLLREKIPAPSIPAGTDPVNARVWLAEALTAGGARQPEDLHQQARLADGGPPIDLGVLMLLVMRHLSGARPSGWTDEWLAAQVAGGRAEDFARGQKLLDEVAVQVDRPATPEPYWWERA